METKTLSPQALQVIKDYLQLPFKDKAVVCPYFNNRRHHVRGALRVMIGKGTPQDIVDEAYLFGFREKVDLKNLSDKETKNFLVDHNLGIDCSGLAYYILEAESLIKKKSRLKKKLFFPWSKNIWRRLLTTFRPVENAGVRTFAHEKNSKKIHLSAVVPGDFIIMLGTGRDHDLNHMLVIHQVDFENNKPSTLHYTHALAWSNDGVYNHGVRQGIIKIVNRDKPLLDQKWTENGVEKNETYSRATTAQELSLRHALFL